MNSKWEYGKEDEDEDLLLNLIEIADQKNL